MKLNKLLKLRRAIEAASESLEDETAVSVPELFPVWKPDTGYTAGERVQFGGILYRVLTAHTSQSGWTPDVSPSLFAVVLIPDPEVIPDWVQPDSTNPYMKGDKVRHVGKTWESLIDGNVWEPGAVGTDALWAEI